MSDRRGGGQRGDLKQRVKTAPCGRCRPSAGWSASSTIPTSRAPSARATAPAPPTSSSRSTSASTCSRPVSASSTSAPPPAAGRRSPPPGSAASPAPKPSGAPGGRIDLLEIEPMPGVDFVTLDFLDPSAPGLLTEMLGGPADVVMSDMAANATGHKKTDHLRIMGLAETARRLRPARSWPRAASTSPRCSRAAPNPACSPTSSATSPSCATSSRRRAGPIRANSTSSPPAIAGGGGRAPGGRGAAGGRLDAVIAPAEAIERAGALLAAAGFVEVARGARAGSLYLAVRAAARSASPATAAPRGRRRHTRGW